MVLFDHNGCLKRYEDALEILREFYDLRLNYYDKRKKYLEGMLEAEALRLSNQARFILEKCDNSLVVENKKKKIMIAELQRRNYDPDPVKKWKAIQAKLEAANDDVALDSDSDSDLEEDAKDADYDYLMGKIILKFISSCVKIQISVLNSYSKNFNLARKFKLTLTLVCTMFLIFLIKVLGAKIHIETSF